MEPFFSFIVPIYNAQQYLSDCLNSILNQTFEDFEAILLDDGSTDQSGAIAKSYADRDPRFRYIRQENQGTSGATNAALSAVRGRYVINLDNDDFVDCGLLVKSKEIVDKYEPDIIQFQSVFVDQDGKEKQRQSFFEKELFFEGNENLKQCEFVMPGAFNRTHSRKVFRRGVIGSIQFSGTSKGADTSFLRRVLFQCERIVLSPDCPFYVREVQTSESRKPNPPYLYKEWLDRELNDLDWCIRMNSTHKRSIPFWEFNDLLDMYQMFAAKAWRENVYDKSYFVRLSKRIWPRRNYLMKPGIAEWARWFLWFHMTRLLAKRLSKIIGGGDFIV